MNQLSFFHNIGFIFMVLSWIVFAFCIAKRNKEIPTSFIALHMIGALSIALKNPLKINTWELFYVMIFGVSMFVYRRYVRFDECKKRNFDESVVSPNDDE
jgi:hypothetical protein